MQHVMHDLETLGQTPGFIILSLGAVVFDETSLGDEFYRVISRRSCEDIFLREEKETADWWARQSPEARRILAEVEDDEVAVPLRDALRDFNDFLGRHGGKRDVRLWGNGSDFDNAGLACAYDALNTSIGVEKIKPGWSFWNNRCYRTFKNQRPDLKLVREGVYHNALDDAKSQARHLQEILAATGLVLN